MDCYEKAKALITNRFAQPIRVLGILGSGLGGYAQRLKDSKVIPYGDIPGFLTSTVPGHAGELHIGYCHGIPTALMKGRFHAYEGYDLADIVYPVRLMRLLGCDTLVVTNAAGGVNLSYQPGDLMLIADHMNLSGQNPLRGKNDERFGPRFPDMTGVYDKTIREKLKARAQKEGIFLQEGVYAMMAGPSFETPAEINMLRTLGADAVGMSTVPEVIAAAHCGMRVVGISCISNIAAGILQKPLNHEEVLQTTAQVNEKFTKCLDLLFAYCAQ